MIAGVQTHRVLRLVGFAVAYGAVLIPDLADQDDGMVGVVFFGLGLLLLGVGTVWWLVRGDPLDRKAEVRRMIHTMWIVVGIQLIAAIGYLEDGEWIGAVFACSLAALFFVWVRRPGFEEKHLEVLRRRDERRGMDA